MENRPCHLKQIVSLGDNLHGVLKPIFREKEEKYFKMLSVDIFTQHAKL